RNVAGLSVPRGWHGRYVVLALAGAAAMSAIGRRATSHLNLRAYCTAALAASLALGTASAVQAQETGEELHILRIEATPIGALPPLALPMPASRNHNYWGIRLQAGRRAGRGGADLTAIAGGIDMQWRGGSIFGVTAGYQARDCEAAEECDGHMMYGGRARFNVVTGGPTIGALLGDYSATSTLGAEMGFGYAPDVLPGLNACTFDLGMPLSLAMLQRVRLVAFATPSIVWDVDCSADEPPMQETWAMSFGMGLQQIGLRGLDVYLGMRKVFRSETGYQLGISVTYVRLP
ncbi:MAG: hypothetical protein ACREKM_02645, partial [Longimicrobiales bacterium]